MTTLDIGAARRPRPGEQICGDDFLVVRGRRTVIALTDGLGHGPQAAIAAERFLAHVREHAQEPVEVVLRSAGPIMAGCRGAVAAVLSVEEGGDVFTVAGVGNIEIHTFTRASCHPVSTAGVIGQPVRRYLVFGDSLVAGDVIILHSDGVSTRADLRPLLGLAPQRLAETIIDRHGKDHDDASCVVVRCGP